jgi:predicted nucleotidyltransferase
MIPEKETKGIQRFMDGLKGIFRERLLSVVLYGSLARGGYVPGKSDINLIVVVQDISAEDLWRVRAALAKTAFKFSIKPVFFTPQFLKSSSEVFPVEWKEIRENHVMLHGADLVAGLEILSEYLRLQLEREVKQQYVNFQQGLIFRKNLSLLLRESCKSLRITLTHIGEFMSEGIQAPEYLETVESAARHSRRRLTGDEITAIAEQHLAYLNQLNGLIDAGKTR